MLKKSFILVIILSVFVVPSFVLANQENIPATSSISNQTTTSGSSTTNVGIPGTTTMYTYPNVAVPPIMPVINNRSYSEEELVSLISKLQKQLEEMRNNKTQCVLPEVDLSVGDGEGDNKEAVKAFEN